LPERIGAELHESGRRRRCVRPGKRVPRAPGRHYKTAHQSAPNSTWRSRSQSVYRIKTTEDVKVSKARAPWGAGRGRQHIAESTASGKNALQKNISFRRHMNRYQENGHDPTNPFSGKNRFLEGDSQLHTQEDDSILCSPDILPPALLLGSCASASSSPRRWHHRQRHRTSTRKASKSMTRPRNLSINLKSCPALTYL